ncbi:metal-dependent hydrolase [Pseudonocardia sulfidoxydans NBRC 16205]|jgi:branched-chain amino acid transport system permease protein|uniref:Metal-dependent hydrolase n=1 Tax=Pseudonocardia sulfidoxydans NBRC 16205 TaxID=1223511 RepID=A0A511DUJ9_9PSEU|nr:branched-chain amino acid ABC transporter ATP-binding protein/permease [Pseudonocardia sulfidoxydans]GEL26768.1 metal-dependent hydrolase [Pseudonocardia sulfidoxydans NBRC 16205]
MFTVAARLGAIKWSYLCLVVILIWGLSSGASFQLVLVTAIAYALGAVGLDVISGYGGQPAIGQGGFMAIGAYMSTIAINDWGMSIAGALGVTLVASILVALLLGFGALRLPHLGLAIVTFCFAYVVNVLVNGTMLGDWTHSVNGLIVDQVSVGPLSFTSERDGLIMSVILLAVVIGLTQLLLFSKYGRWLMAVKRSETMTAAIGVDPLTVKMLAYVWSSVCGALGGVVLAQSQGTISPDTFNVMLSIMLFSLVAVGGLGTVCGPILAAIVYVVIQDAGSTNDSAGMWWPILFMVVLILAPGGGFELVSRVFAMVGATWRRVGGGRIRLPERVRERLDGLGRRRGRAIPVVAEADVVRPAASDQEAGDLVVEGVRVTFGGVVAVDSVGFSVRAGSIHALIGPNGAGKTTVLDVLTGITRQRAGDVRVGGRDVLTVPTRKRIRLGMGRAFQHPALVGDLTVFDNVLMAAEAANRPPLGLARRRRVRAENSERAGWALTVVDVDPATWSEAADTLTGGHRKLVDIARAIAAEPHLLLLDEPTSGVRAEETDAIARAIRQVRAAGTTVLTVDHNVAFIRDIAEHTTVLNFGRVIADGATSEVMKDPAVAAAFLGTERTAADV